MDEIRKRDIAALAMAMDEIVCRTNQNRGKFQNGKEEKGVKASGKRGGSSRNLALIFHFDTEKNYFFVLVSGKIIVIFIILTFQIEIC